MFYGILNKGYTNQTVLIGRTKHCFVAKDNKPIILKKEFPEFDKKLKRLIGDV